jgi:hypothetical protein
MLARGFMVTCYIKILYNVYNTVQLGKAFSIVFTFFYRADRLYGALTLLFSIYLFIYKFS